uniref:Aminotransferase-like plant mobile domain-containing protein n=1 Tax=Fagus sylvatica TaxID=28930 RepID=A0A2N9IRX6_FAGSY
MASSSSKVPVDPPLQPSAGEGLEAPPAVPAASTEAMVDAPMASSAPFQANPRWQLPPPFLEDWDWTVSGLEPTVDQAWVPNLDEISELLIQKGDLQAAPINFDFLCAASKDWGCNMFRDTESLRELAEEMVPLQRTPSFSLRLSAEEEVIATALRKHSSTRLSGWPSSFVHHKDASVRHAAFALYWLFSYVFAARDKSAAWSRFSDLPREFLDRFPGHMGMITPAFTCASIFRKFYQPSPLIRDLKVDDYRSLSYLSTVNPGYTHVGPQETATCVADLTAFLKSRAFARWGGETTRVLIPGGHRLGFNTPSMGAYWQRFTQSMVEFVIAGRSDKTPMSVHRKPLVSNPYLTPPSQSAISYANSQKLGFAEWDGVREGWIAYTIHLPEGWRNSVNVVEDRLIMLSKRGKGGKREAPVDLAIEKTSKKPTPSIPSPKKAPAKKTKAGKKGKSTASVPSAAKESTTTPMEELTESTVGPSKKTKVGKKSKSTVSVPPAAKESTTAPVEEPIESTVAPPKPKSMSASPSKKSGKKSAAPRPPKGQKKVSISSSSPDEEEPSAVSTSPPSKKKKFVAPLFPLGAAGRTRSRSGPKVAHGSGRSGGGVVDVEDPDVADDDVIASPLRKDAPQTAAVGQDEELRKSVADSSEVGAESTGEDHSSSDDSFFDSAPDSVPEEHIMSAGSTADDDDMPGTDDFNAVDADADPISFSVPQTVLTSAGSDASMAYIMEGISLFGTTPSFRAIPAGGFVISASRIASEIPPVVGGAFVPGETHVQSLVESESVVDLGVSTADHNAPIEDAGASAADTLAGSDHLENIGMDDTVHVSEDVGEVGITGEVTAVSPPPRPTIEAGSSVGVGSLSSEVADFLKEFDAKAPNPHPEQYFWSFNGPLVPFGDFWVPNDCSPYLSRLSAGHSDFTKGFKLSIGLGGPMLSLLGSVLAAMSESSLEDVTTTQILAWRSVIQDLMDVGFDLGFMIERLRQTAQCLFGKRLADEIKALQH